MKRSLLRYSLYGVLASILATPALAQTAPSAAAPAGPTPSPQAAPSNTIGEVVVTAQRFAQTAQKTPLIITALDATQLQGVTDIRSLQAVTPGIQLGTAGNVVQTFFRGIGSLNVTTSQESSVAYNADGVFLFTSSMINPLMYDLERVEILKGPQGTLYGRNASGGAVNLLLHGAALNRFEGYVEGEYGNYNEGRVTAAVNVPVNDTLAFRLAGQHVSHEGYLSDGTDDQNQNSGRLRVLWKPTSTVTLHVGIDGSAANSKGAGSSLNPNPSSNKWVGALDPSVQTGPFFLGGTSLLSAPPNPPPFYKNHQWSGYAQLDVDLGPATLTVLPAYRNEDLGYQDYVPGFFDGEHFITRQTSIEARLGHHTDRLTWVAGAYYFKVNLHGNLRVRNETNFQDQLLDNPTQVESHAFFGETTFSVLDNVRLIGGLRYTQERTTGSGSVNSLIGPPGLPETPAFNPFNPVTNPTGEPLDYVIDKHSHDHALTWKGGAELDLTPHSMLFATASRGFKGGGNYNDFPGVDASFKPEYLTAYELGSRNRFFDNTLQVNAELFYWQLQDQQITYVGFDSLNQVTLLTVNAGRAHMYGADLDVVWKATGNDTIHVGGEYLQSEYDAFLRTIPSAATLITTNCQVKNFVPPSPITGPSLAPATVDCAGMPVLRAPKWSGSVSYEHRFRLANDSDVVFDAESVLAGPSYVTPAYTHDFMQAGYAIFNASLTYKAPGKALSLTGWVKNLSDTRVMSGGDQFVDAYARPTLLPPRTFGATVRYAF